MIRDDERSAEEKAFAARHWDAVKEQQDKSKTPFEVLLKIQIRKLIRDWKADGTVSASVECLMQCVRPPAHTEEGAPRGTNACYYYAEMFRRICFETSDIAAFISK